MKKNKKYLAAAAAACMVVGAIIGGIGIGLGGRPGFYVNASGIHSYNSNRKSDSKNILEKTSLDEFTSIQLNIPYGNVYIIPSDDYYIEYRLDRQAQNINYTVKDSVLTMNMDASSGLQFFSFGLFDNNGENYVKLYLPQDQIFDSVYVDAGMGNVSVGNITAKNMELNLSLGDLDVDHVTGDSFCAALDSGNLKISRLDSKTAVLNNGLGDINCNALVSQNTEITLDSGNLYLGELSTGTLSIETGLGDVTIDSLEADSEGTVTLDLGNFTANYCKFNDLDINSSLGNVTLCLDGTKNDYQMDLSADLGKISVDGYREANDEDTSRFISQSENGSILNVYSDSGDVDIQFKRNNIR